MTSEDSLAAESLAKHSVTWGRSKASSFFLCQFAICKREKYHSFVAGCDNLVGSIVPAQRKDHVPYSLATSNRSPGLARLELRFDVVNVDIMIVGHVAHSQILAVWRESRILDALDAGLVSQEDLLHSLIVPNTKQRVWSDLSRSAEHAVRRDSHAVNVILVSAEELLRVLFLVHHDSKASTVIHKLAIGGVSQVVTNIMAPNSKSILKVQ